MDSVSGKRVYVGLSGGVDSSVSATLLQKQGALVTGVFIKGWYPPGMPCTWASDRRDAMRVAARLKIPFKTLDASVEYKSGVIEYMLREYRSGRTPNPDIMCNREVKFKVFANFAFNEGADYIATGHYARSEAGELYRGVDATKDQSYFLWAVPKATIQRTLFPLGGLLKEETRALAEKFNLPNAKKKDSQGICFLGNIQMEDFLVSEFGEQPGSAVAMDGSPVGTHSGAILHTLGSRITLEGALPGPWYVVKKDIEKNELTVSHRKTEGQTKKDINLQEVNYFSTPVDALLQAQFRYHGPYLSGNLAENGKVFLPKDIPQEPIASGQSLVMYDDDRCIGGGIIE